MTSCRDCRFWKPHNSIAESDLNVGECRATAPAPVVTATLTSAPPGLYSAYWPQTFAQDGCGDGEPV